ncbi:MAG: hypothetical protein NTX01_08780 [Candidatus Omnitrophica bacterium]|nr:hypothetical protein [Candidatus Omnitrophota bacterium]
MTKKNLIVIGIGLIILIIAAGIAYQNYEYAKMAREEINTLNAVIQQKDVKIAKLTKEIKVKQDELNAVKVEFDNTKKALDEVKAKINKVAQLNEKNEKEEKGEKVEPKGDK